MLGGAIANALSQERESSSGSAESTSDNTIVTLHTAAGIFESRNLEERTFIGLVSKITRNIGESYRKNGLMPAAEGCGCLMRVIPAAFFTHDYCLDSIHVATLGAEVAKITHKSPMCFMPAAMLVFILFQLADENREITKTVFMDVISDCRNLLPNFIDNEKEKTYQDLYKEEVESIRRSIDKAIRLSFSKMDEQEAIAGLGDGLSAEEALSIGIYCCLKHFGDFSQTVRTAVDLSGRSMYTGPVAGSIAGLIAGSGGIPAEYKERLGMADRILSISENLSLENPLFQFPDAQATGKYVE